MTLSIETKYGPKNSCLGRDFLFDSQDAEYYTVGWIAFCRFLGQIATLDTETINDQHLKILASRLTADRILEFENFIKSTIAEKYATGRELQNLMAQLAIQAHTHNPMNTYRKSTTKRGVEFGELEYKINQRMLDAIWLYHSCQEEAQVAFKQNNLGRHNKNIEELIDYYTKKADLSLVQGNLSEELNWVHTNLEYYLGYYDPEPMAGQYKSDR